MMAEFTNLPADIVLIIYSKVLEILVTKTIIVNVTDKDIKMCILELTRINRQARNTILSNNSRQFWLFVFELLSIPNDILGYIDKGKNIGLDAWNCLLEDGRIIDWKYFSEENEEGIIGPYCEYYLKQGFQINITNNPIIMTIYGKEYDSETISCKTYNIKQFSKYSKLVSYTIYSKKDKDILDHVPKDALEILGLDTSDGEVKEKKDGEYTSDNMHNFVILKLILDRENKESIVSELTDVYFMIDNYHNGYYSHCAGIFCGEKEILKIVL